MGKGIAWVLDKRGLGSAKGRGTGCLPSGDLGELGRKGGGQCRSRRERRKIAHKELRRQFDDFADDAPGHEGVEFMQSVHGAAGCCWDAAGPQAGGGEARAGVPRGYPPLPECDEVACTILGVRTPDLNFRINFRFRPTGGL